MPKAPPRLLAGLLAAALLLAAPSAGHAQAGDGGFVPLRPDGNGIAALERPVRVRVDGEPLGEAVRLLLSRAGVALAYDRALPGVERPVTLLAEGESAAAAALRLLRGSGLELRVSPGGQAVLVRARPPASPLAERPSPPPAPARQGGEAVHGVLVEEPSGRPVGEALVVLLDSAGTRRRGALTDTLGRFHLPAPGPGRYTLAAERVGYAITSSPALEIAPGETVRLRMAARVRAVVLSRISTSGGRARCETRPAEAERTRVLWEEARKALAATAWAEESALFDFRVRRWKRPVNASTLKEGRETDRFAVITAPRPFESLPAADLARNGYVRRDAGEMVFYAPDAHVLLSTEFLSEHCFRVVPGNPRQEGWVGLSFEPVRGQRRPDVRGTLWLDRATAELREMEFSYTGLPDDADHHAVGGWLLFERLEGGVWIVRRWEIRVPVVRAAYMNPAVFDVAGQRLSELLEHGGEVLDLVPRRGVSMYRGR